MELLSTILYYVGLWLGIGIAITLIKIFGYFRGPTHMMYLYLTHKRTAKHAKELYEMAARNSKHPVEHIVLIQVVFGAIFMPLAVIEFIVDFFMFFNYTPPVPKQNTEDTK